jgi:16S rRNA processing protein RimM
MNQLISIGYTKKPHGLKGEIKLYVYDRYLEDLLEADLVLLDLKGKHTPFFIEDIRVGNHIIAKFEDINTPEAALAIGSKEMFLREEDLLSDADRQFDVEQLPFTHCVGYSIYEGEKLLGIIEEIIEYPQQEMAMIHYQNREVLVPLNEHFVKKMDDKNKKIIVELPDGILDL